MSSPPVAAAPFAFDEPGWEGTERFAQMLVTVVGSPDRVVMARRLDWSDLTPKDAVIVLHPNQPLSADDLSAFLRAGGRLAFLDDYGRADVNLSRFQVKRVAAPTRPVQSLRNNPNLAIARPVVEMSAGHVTGTHPVVANVSRVVTNHPTAFEHPGLTPLLRIQARDEPDAVIAVAGQVGQGRLIAVSDGSIVINMMLRYPGNRAFAEGLIRYLVADDTWGTRNGRVFLVANDVVESGAYSDNKTATRPLRAFWHRLEEWLEQAHRSGVSSQVAAIIGLASVMFSLVWIVGVAVRTFGRSAPRYARPTPLVSQGGTAGRAAVVAAPSTHRALTFLEQKSALEEGLAVRLGLDLPVASSHLLDAIQESGKLDEQRFQVLRRLLFAMGVVETSVAAGHPVRVRQADIAAATARTRELLDALDGRT